MLTPVDRPAWRAPAKPYPGSIGKDAMLRAIRTTAIALLLAAIAGSPAVGGGLARAVRCRDLDLTSPSGVQELGRRMRWAADYLCRQQEEGDPLTKLEGRDCRQAVLDRAGPTMIRAIESADRDVPVAAAAGPHRAGLILRTPARQAKPA